MNRMRVGPLLSLGLGLVAVAGLAVVLPDRGSPGLRGTLVVAPLVVALFEWVRAASGGRRAGKMEWVARLVWVGVVLARGALGLGAAATPFLFAGFLILVGVRGAILLPALRRRVRPGGSVRRSSVFFLFTLAVGIAFLPWLHAAVEPNGDEPYYLLLADSLAHDGDVDLRNQYEAHRASAFLSHDLGPQPGDPVGSHGELYSRHQPMLPLLLVPFWIAGGALGARFAMLLAWAWLGERMLQLCLGLGASPRGAFRAWLAATFSPPLLLYAGAVWVEVPAALLVTLAVTVWVRSGGGSTRRSSAIWLTGIALAFLPLLKLRFLLVALPVAAALFVADRRRRARWLLPILAAGAGGLALVANWLSIGNALGVHALGELLVWDVPVTHYLLALDGLLTDLSFGLLVCGPIWLLALLGTPRLARQSRAAAWIVLAGLPYVLAVASRAEWYGGWSPPFRYCIVILPLLTVCLAHGFDRPPSRRERTLRAALGLSTLILAGVFLVEPGWAVSFADGRSRLLDVLAAPFRMDLARFLPSSIRPRLATWLAPLVLALAVLPALRGRRGPRRSVIARAAAWLLAGVALWVAAARWVPTRWAEVEDPWVVKSGGQLYPAPWTPDRAHYTGGWQMSSAARLRLRPVAGGSRVRVSARLRVMWRQSPPARLEMLRDGAVIASWPAKDFEWRVEQAPPIVWRSGDEVTLRVVPVDEARPGVTVLIDRLGFEWR